MKISIAAPQTGVLAGADQLTRIGRLAEDLGFDSIWVLDRLLAPIAPNEGYPARADGVLPAQFRRTLDPLAALAYLSAQTTRVGLGASVLAVPLYHAPVLARHLAAVDVLSDGRLKVGLGGGWSTDEMCAVGAPRDRRSARIDEFVETMIAAWTADIVEYSGEFECIPSSHVDLKPIQRPHPPIYMAAYAPASMQRVARFARGWNPAGVPIDALGGMFAMVRSMAVAAGRAAQDIEMVVRANITVTAQSLGNDRESFHGSLGQVMDDVTRCREVGASEVILDAQFCDLVAGDIDAYAGFVQAAADALLSVAV